mgnify:FL=1
MAREDLKERIRNQPGAVDRLEAVSAHQMPASDSHSDIRITPTDDQTNYLRHRPTGLFALLCPFELSNPAFVTSAALLLGTPVPHALYLKARTIQYHDIDAFGDSLLTSAVHAAHTRIQSHDRIANTIAELATQHGIPSTTRHVPLANHHSHRKADIVTCCGGLVLPDQDLNFGRTTHLVMDFELGHPYTSQHVFKPNNLSTMEATKRNKYVSDYHAQGLAFAPLVSNSFGQFGPDLLRLLWRLADHAAHHHLPSALQAAPVLDPAVNSQLQATHKRLRGHIYVQSTYRLLAAFFESITEHIYGRTFTLKTLPRNQEIIAARLQVQPWLHPTLPLPSPAFTLKTLFNNQEIIAG